ncbi:hypothetical protein Sango_0756000 [Sesamum angolense]|uniref:Transcription initiation factor IIF subunit beta n=1 Tax=Sesamum angolense TaxID=2727404 RepID=A0AAE1X393_9LAMI|nr:hypothetical protein Sango_0756000 [Sesamum angolense]
MAEKPNSESNNSTSAAVPTTSSYLETSKAERHVWLMKCPPVVSRAMQNHQRHPPLPFSSDAGSGKTIGKVVVSVDPLGPNDDFSSTQFTMELAGTADTNMPKCYSMDMSTDFIPMSVFAESSQVESILFKISEDKKKIQAKGPENRRTRRDPEEMEKIMFKLFEKQPNWTLKKLIQETDQPEQFLKDMLKLLCVYNNKGANQGTYQLKPEYRGSEDKSDAMQTTSR